MASFRPVSRGSTFFGFFLRYLLVVLIPIGMLLAMGTVAMVINQTYISRQILQSNTRTLEQIRDNFDLTFQELDSIALSFSVSFQFLQSLKGIVTSNVITFQKSRILATIRNFVDVAAYSRPYVQSIYVYTANARDKLLTTSDGIVALSGFYDHGWYESFLRHPDSELAWTETRNIARFPSLESGTPVLSVFRRIYSLTGFETPGVVVLNIDLKYLRGSIDRMKGSPQQYIVILNKNGDPLINEFPVSFSFTRLPPERNTDGRPVVRDFSAGGKRYVEIQLYSPDNGWSYLSFMPETAFYEPATIMRDINITLIALAFSIGLVLTYFGSRRSFRHIESIVDIVDAAAKGKPLPPAPVHTEKGLAQITYSILRTFVEHKYMKVQLSERKYRHKTLQLLALQSQLNPHFLFNTLETINWKVLEYTRTPTMANEIIHKLSRILKYSLQSPFTLETLRNEIRYAKDYIAIQRIRYKNKFRVAWKCDDDIGDYGVVKFLLQPLIENAIYHGIKEMEGRGSITISIRRTEDLIRIVVTDTGKGMPADRLKEVRECLTLEIDDQYSESIGLLNTHKRIQLAFGDQYGLYIDSTPGKGTEVVAGIPAEIPGENQNIV